MILELNDKFRDFKYRDSDHSYFHKDIKLMSVTQFLGKIKPKFDKEYWSVRKAYQFSGFQVKRDWRSMTEFYVADTYFTNGDGDQDWQYYTVSIYDDHSHLKVKPEDVLAQWAIDNQIGVTRGTYIHNYLECKERNLLDDPTIPNVPNAGIVTQVKYFNSISQASKICDQFLEYQNENLVPVGIECIVGNLELGLAGRFDRLYFNKLTQEYEIWDFKTDKQIRFKSEYKTKISLFNIPDCEYEKYSLQTSMYRYMIEQQLNCKLGTSRVVHINLKENNYQIIDCKDYTDLINNKKDEINWTTSV